VGAEKERPPPRPERGDGLENERLPDRLNPESTEAAAAPQDGAEAPSFISPIACAFDGDELLLGSIRNMADLAASYARSAAEAAYRGDVDQISVHLERAASAIKGARMNYAVIKGEATAADAELAST
jgi:hypothetical protein